MLQGIELKRKKLELLRVSTGKAENEFKIEELNEDIKRVQANIKLQAEKEESLKLALAEAEKPKRSQ